MANRTAARGDAPDADLIAKSNLDSERPLDQPQELATLLEVSRLIASVLELSPLLDLILTQLNRVASYSGASIWLLDSDGLFMVADRAPAGHAVASGLRIPLEKVGWVETDEPEPVIVADVQDEQDQSHNARSYRAAVGNQFGYSHSWMRIPLVFQGKTIGMISLSHRQPGHFTAHHAELAMAIANQAAVAITNARLVEHAQTMAAVEERQRLARELHDSVTQALFSITLHARAAQLAFAQTGLDPDGPLGRSIADVRELTQGALAEMRALIFELRPDALAEEGLARAVRKQAAALSAREGIEIQMEMPEERLDLPAEVEEHLYRITLEALHNTIKHASASRAWVRLTQRADETTLIEIGDDGSGFDTNRAAPGHLGLHTMAERASVIGAALTVESAPGYGTRVRIALPHPAASERTEDDR